MAEVSDTWRKQIQEKVEAARAEEAEASATRQQVQAEVEQLNRYIQAGALVSFNFAPLILVSRASPQTNKSERGGLGKKDIST